MVIIYKEVMITPLIKPLFLFNFPFIIDDIKKIIDEVIKLKVFKVFNMRHEPKCDSKLIDIETRIPESYSGEWQT